MKTILIDLDGVLNEYNGEFNSKYIPPMKKDAKEFLEKLSAKYRLVLFTTRNRLEASKWLIENSLDKYFSDVSNVKEASYLIIDDRCINFNGDFEDILSKIQNFKIWYNK